MCVSEGGRKGGMREEGGREGKSQDGREGGSEECVEQMREDEGWREGERGRRREWGSWAVREGGCG